MEDAHAAVLDLQSEDNKSPAPPDKRMAYFGVYDGHGGEKVAQYAGENIHKIVAKQDSFAKGNIEQALKDGFLATDRAILSGKRAAWTAVTRPGLTGYRYAVRRRSVRMYSLCGSSVQRQNLGGTKKHTLDFVVS